MCNGDHLREWESYILTNFVDGVNKAPGKEERSCWDWGWLYLFCAKWNKMAIGCLKSNEILMFVYLRLSSIVPVVLVNNTI